MAVGPPRIAWDAGGRAGQPAAASGRTSRGPPVWRAASIGVAVQQLAHDVAPRETSWIDELVLMITRWASAGSASALTSSGMT